MNLYLEQIIFFYIIRNKDLTEMFKGSYFQSKHIQVLFDLVKPYIIEYGEEPTLSQVIELKNMAGKSDVISDEAINTVWEARSKVDSYGKDWLQENTIALAQWQNLITGLKKTLTYIKTIESDVTFDNCGEIVTKAKNIFQNETNFDPTDPGDVHDFSDYSTHEVKEKDILKSGYDFIDISLEGGMSRKSLYCFVGGMKTGKSMWLANLCAESIKRGQNCAYITLELPYNKVAKRIGSNLYNIPVFDYNSALEDKEFFMKKTKEFYSGNFMQKPGKLVIIEYPTSSATIDKIESDLLKAEAKFSTAENPFKFDKIFIDYLAIMADSKNPRSENTYLKLKNISEMTRAAMQRNNWCGITVNQLNRGGLDNANPTMGDMSEGISIGMTVDGLFIIIRTTTMNAQGIYYLKTELARDSEHMGEKKKFIFDKKYLRITESSEPIIAADVEIADIAANPAPAVPEVLNVGIDLNSPKTDLGFTEANITGADLFK